MWIKDLLDRSSKEFITAIGLLFVLVLWIVDYQTGPNISLIMFYVMPVILVTWYVGTRGGVFISIMAAIAWFVADTMAPPPYEHPVIPFWNVTEKFGFFLLVTFFLSTLKHSFEREKELARTDYLTGVANGRCFSEFVEGEIRRTHRYGHSFSVAYLDIDNFKRINDTEGHYAGDLLLIKVAETISYNVRSVDLVARLGGDEFVVMMPETGRNDADIAIKKVQQKLLEVMNRNNWPVTFSIGLATYMKPPESFDSMIKKVDDLMYSVKVSGKNNIRHEVEGISKGSIDSENSDMNKKTAAGSESAEVH